MPDISIVWQITGQYHYPRRRTPRAVSISGGEAGVARGEAIAVEKGHDVPNLKATILAHRDMKQSALHTNHEQLGAHFAPVGDWDMPAHYGDPVAEHHAVRQGVGMADLSHRGTLRITGDDRVTWLQSIISNDILPLQPGQWLPSGFLSHKGKMLSYFRVYRLEESLFVEDMGEVGDATYQAFKKFLLYGTKAKMQNCVDTWGILLVGGPKAPPLLQQALGLAVADVPAGSFLTHDLNGQSILLARTQETGECDVEIFAPRDALEQVWQRVWEAGKTFDLRAVGTQARESLRIEAGIPKLGPDVNDQIVPPEANLEGKAFSLSKGCYPGQEVVARMDTYGNVKRRLVGLVIDAQENGIPPAHAKVFSEDREVGWISSATHSPTLNATIALGFPLRDFSAPGTALNVEINGQRRSAVVRALPFYTAG